MQISLKGITEKNQFRLNHWVYDFANYPREVYKLLWIYIYLLKAFQRNEQRQKYSSDYANGLGCEGLR